MRIRRRTIYTFIFAVAWCGGGFAFSDETNTVEDRFRIAMEQLGHVSVEESVRALKDVLALDEDYTPAYAEIAKLYMSLNTPLDRQSAEKMVRRAIRLDRDNAAHQLLLGDLMWAQGFLTNAKRQYEAVLTQDPRNARAAFGLGTYYVKDFLKYWNMIDMEGSSHSVMLEWRHFAEEYRERAIQSLERSIEHETRVQRCVLSVGPGLHGGHEIRAFGRREGADQRRQLTVKGVPA